MYHSKRTAATRLLFALAMLVLSAETALNAQISSPDEGRWPTCAYPPTAEEHLTGPNFTVRVSFREQQLAGLKVILSVVSAEFGQNVGDAAATARTDSDGVAHFFAIPSGMYRAHVEKALLAETREIQVQADSSSENRVEIEWPSSPIRAGNLRGQIFSWQKSTPQNRAELLPHKNVFVQLLDLRSGTPLASVHTDSEGYYEFASYPDGAYVIRVAEHPDPSINNYDSAVELATGATQGNIPDLIVYDVCGNGMVEMMDQADAQASALFAPK